jgi:hypothetical protein
LGCECGEQKVDRLWTIDQADMEADPGPMGQDNYEERLPESLRHLPHDDLEDELGRNEVGQHDDRIDEEEASSNTH